MAAQQIARRHKEEVLRKLKRDSAVALLGQPQTGKTTIARAIASELKGIYLDCQDRLTSQMIAEGGLRSFASMHAGQLIVIDEFHRQVNLFPELRGIIDARRREGHGSGCFLLVGPGSIRNANKSNESLVGRISYVELNPLDVLDLPGAGEEEIDKLWLRGGLPASLAAPSDERSFEMREDMLRSILSEAIIEDGLRAGYPKLRDLCTLLAQGQGRPLNVMKICREIELNPRTVRRFVDGQRVRLLARVLPAHYRHAKKRLKNTPKFYYRDSGLLHRLLSISAKDVMKINVSTGMSWEGFVIENILRQLSYEDEAHPGYYGAAGGAEIDLVIEQPGAGLWAIEIKRGAGAVSRGFQSACQDLAPARRFVVHGGRLSYRDRNGVEHMTLPDMCRGVAAAFAP